jgi:hypothetical protein
MDRPPPNAVVWRLFSEGHTRSPFSGSPSGEGNAIKSCGLGNSELTFVSGSDRAGGARDETPSCDWAEELLKATDDRWPVNPRS